MPMPALLQSQVGRHAGITMLWRSGMCSRPKHLLGAAWVGRRVAHAGQALLQSQEGEAP